jgi:hypothetical protein
MTFDPFYLFRGSFTAVTMAIYALNGNVANAPTNSSVAQPSMGPSKASEISDCSWYVPFPTSNTDQGAEDMECVYSSLRFSTQSAVNVAKESAKSCAASTGERCILTSEVGFEVPGVFLWNSTQMDMHAYLAPRILDQERHSKSQNTTVAVVDPRSEQGSTEFLDHFKTNRFEFYEWIEIEYLTPPPISTKKVILKDYESYCVQLLLLSLSDKCTAAYGM